MFRTIDISSPRLWAVATVLLVLVVEKIRTDSAQAVVDTAPSPSWSVGRPMPIAVEGGRASFEVPTPSTTCRTLVIVSSLARSGDAAALRLSARGASQAREVKLEPEPVRRLPTVCGPRVEPTPAAVAKLPPARREFHLLAHGGDVARASSYVTVQGRLAAVGRRIQVYVDAKDLGTVTASTLKDLVATFDDGVYPALAGRFGPAADVDRDGRFSVLFSSWLGRLAGGSASVDGYVRGADLDPALAPPFGNRCDMMYLNPTLTAGPHLRTILAHEYTHAVTFSRKALAGGHGGQEEEGWLDEAIAHLVEDALGYSRSNIDYRVSAFLSRPEGYRLVVDDYYAAHLFRSHGNRGATYLFLRWCIDQYGPGLLDSLVRSELRGVENLETATGSSFADLFRRWTVALYFSGLDPSSVVAGESYRSIDLRGELEDWILAGPRVTSVLPGGSDDTWQAAATTTHYVVVEGSATGAVAVEVVGSPEAELQVTAIRLPSGSTRPELKLRSWSSPDGEVRIKAEVTEPDGSPLRLGALAWEPLIHPDDPRASASRRGGLDMLGIARAFGTSNLASKIGLKSRPIPLPGVRIGDGPVIFKAVGTDPSGRRVAAWAELVPTARSASGVLDDDSEAF